MPNPPHNTSLNADASDAAGRAGYDAHSTPENADRRGSYEPVRNPKRGCDFSIPNVIVCREPSAAEQVDPGPPPEVIKGDPATCRHGVMDEMVGAYWGFEDCVSCGKRFPARDDIDYGGDSWAG